MGEQLESEIEMRAGCRQEILLQVTGRYNTIVLTQDYTVCEDRCEKSQFVIDFDLLPCMVGNLRTEEYDRGTNVFSDVINIYICKVMECVENGHALVLRNLYDVFTVEYPRGLIILFHHGRNNVLNLKNVNRLRNFTQVFIKYIFTLGKPYF